MFEMELTEQRGRGGRPQRRLVDVIKKRKSWKQMICCGAPWREQPTEEEEEEEARHSDPLKYS